MFKTKVNSKIYTNKNSICSNIFRGVLRPMLILLGEGWGWGWSMLQQIFFDGFFIRNDLHYTRILTLLSVFVIKSFFHRTPDSIL